MPYNGSGTFILPSGNPVVTGTTISSVTTNNTNNDIANGLSNAVTRNGQSPPTVNLPMGNFKLTGLAAGTVAGDSARYDELILKADLISPVLVTPNLGTPSAGVLTNCTGTAAGLSIGGNAATVTTNANLTGAVTSVGNVSSLGSFTSAQLATALTNETGTGSAVFATSPTLTSPVIAGTPTGVGVLTSGTAVASTSGTSIDFTGIPSWAKRITVMFNGVSTNGSSVVQAQIGNGSVISTGYANYTTASAGTLSNIGLTTGIALNTVGNSVATCLYYGNINFTLVTANTWVSNFVLGVYANANTTTSGGGSLTLSGSLDRVRITTVNGTDTFDAGSINIMYE